VEGHVSKVVLELDSSSFSMLSHFAEKFGTKAEIEHLLELAKDGPHLK